ncbi:hypothetical protein [Sphingomonas kyeonggiensis]|uniref:Uncharacterized protein n=1 Tax=Sphingomonas kyeonggiensis TaxID=1268553 RepID=A0A7W6JVF2_9SPHN|nr:hypothetical protein [Sphingomonas kyeonggiensis]MBB4100225.1 hypothetical protein [Sphingomonas kyeonggiensis]
MADPGIRRRLVRAAIGAVVGLALGFGAGEIGLFDWLSAMPGEDIGSTAVAGVLLLLGLFAVIAASSSALYRRMAENYREGDPLDGSVLRYLRTSGVVMLLAAVLLLAPPLAVRYGLTGDAAIAVAAGMAALLAFQVWLNLRVMRTSDELSRAAMAEASVASFWLLQLGLFGWAVLAKLGLAANVSLWTLMTLSTVIYLIVSIVAAIRRGMFA